MNDNLSLNKLEDIFNSNILTDNSVISISKELNLTERFAYLLKFRLIEFSIKELSYIESFNIRTIEILGLISLMESSKRGILLKEFDKINFENNPFEKIEEILSENKSPDTLALLSDKFWSCIHDYLIERSINQYPFNLKSIQFIKSIGRTKYLNLSEKQKNWLNNLIIADFNGFDPNPIFRNSILIEKGLKEDFDLINKYFTSLV